MGCIKASNTGGPSPGEDLGDFFGSVAVSGDTVVVGALDEDSNATGVNGNQSDNTSPHSGAAYVFASLGFGPELAIAGDGSGGYVIRMNGISGLTYQLQRATSVTGPWTTNTTSTALSSGLIEFHDTNAPLGQAFYRTIEK